LKGSEEVKMGLKETFLALILIGFFARLRP